MASLAWTRPALIASALAVASCGGTARQQETAPSTPSAGATARLLAVGDVADCKTTEDSATAALAAARPGEIALLGDTVYETGTKEEYAQCYEPAWGPLLDRTRPAVGNHEYRDASTGEETGDAAGYFEYYGDRAGRPGEGWYSYELGAWHIVVLNSNCERVGGCGEGSPQGRWLRADLERNTARCTLAYWHHSRFSTGSEHGDQTVVEPFWNLLDRYNAEVVLSAHDHHYERFAPQSPTGEPDPTGVRQFVVGTGGRGLRPLAETQPNSEARSADAFGILDLTLRPAGYDWRFVPIEGSSFSDSGSGSCR